MNNRRFASVRLEKWGGALDDELKAALDNLDQQRLAVLADQVTFTRRKRQLATMLTKCDAIMADCATIRAALDEAGEAETEQPA